MTEPETTSVPNSNPHNEIEGNNAKKKNGTINVPLLLFILLVSCLLLGTVSLAVRVNSANKDGLMLLANVSVNILVFAAIVVQAYIYRGQWQSMREGLERTDRLLAQTEEHFYVSQRAYLGVDNAGFIGNKVVPNEPLTLLFTVSNSGETPAWNLHPLFAITSETLETAMDEAPSLGSGKMDKIVGQVTKGAPHDISGPLLVYTDEHVRQINSGERRLAVFVELRYTCIQKRDETDTFFFIYNPQTGTFKRRREWTRYIGPEVSVLSMG
jgi:hypothetical protein